ncbi:hypothetical protein D3C72_1342310 [compost metagenome]
MVSFMVCMLKSLSFWNASSVFVVMPKTISRAAACAAYLGSSLTAGIMVSFGLSPCIGRGKCPASLAPEMVEVGVRVAGGENTSTRGSVPARQRRGRRDPSVDSCGHWTRRSCWTNSVCRRRSVRRRDYACDAPRLKSLSFWNAGLTFRRRGRFLHPHLITRPQTKSSELLHRLQASKLRRRTGLIQASGATTQLFHDVCGGEQQP